MDQLLPAPDVPAISIRRPSGTNTGSPVIVSMPHGAPGSQPDRSMPSAALRVRSVMVARSP
ncbi:hypothetical protein ACFU6I_40085 [Streptomyces sp. NPDC057486]|uniref:hypothetical protein n=1 Tax=Streptomyces sp. NPDC057486 TaxID=3346145 RepID=UPI00367B0FAD